MDKMFAWLEQLTSFLYSLFPHIFVVNANERAIAFARGKKVKELDPGVQWYWPLVTDEPTSVNVTRDAESFTSQKLTTSDGKRVGISIVVPHRVVDVRKAVVDTNEFAETMSEVTSAACTFAVLSRRWEDIRRDILNETFQEEILDKVQDHVANYGVQILGVHVKDVAETLVLSFMGDGCLTGSLE